MSVTIDANVLIEASNASSGRNVIARRAVESLVDQDDILYVFWPVALAFLRVVTHSRLFPEPMDLGTALASIEALTARPNVRTGSERRGFLAQLRITASGGAARGQLIHDAHIVALMRQHDVSTIWTNDRDFLRFDGIRVVDPFA